MSEEGDTTVIPGSRGKLAFFAVFCALLAVAGARFSFFVIALALRDPAALLNVEGRYALYAPFMPILAPCLTLYFAYLALQTARKSANPPHLEMSSAGLELVTQGRGVTWRWDEIDSLEFDPWKGRIIFNGDRSDSGGRFGRFPRGLNISVRALFDMLVEGKRRWGSPTPAEESAAMDQVKVS